MRSYRFARRAFLAGIGGAVGLKVLLRNLEVAAQGATSPPRFLMIHWPVGTVRYRYLPTGAGTNFTFSPILKPFETAGLKDDLTILFGLSFNGIDNGGGGGHEAGTPMSSTGAHCPGTRRNGGEADDACAGGPSWDQLLLKNVPDLQRPGLGYANAICDARVDSLETSAQCLSYGYDKQDVTSERPVAGGTITENVPLLPTLSPVQLYMNLFSGFMPGGSTPANQEALLRALRARKSVLDYSLRELDEIKLLAPGSEVDKIDAHAAAIRAIEQQISGQIESGMIADPSCVVPDPPDPNVAGETGSGGPGDPMVSTADDEEHETIGKLHASIIKAAFQCDLIRVATLQWSPGTNHVSFKGLHPDDPNAIYMHHPLSHRIGSKADVFDALPADQELAGVVEYLTNVHTWYNQKIADIMVDFKNTLDAFGNSLLDHMVVPCITEVAETTHSWSPMPALIIGGKALGMQGGQFLNFENDVRSQNDMWVTVAQPFLKTADPLSALAAEAFYKDGVSPIEGLWVAPP